MMQRYLSHALWCFVAAGVILAKHPSFVPDWVGFVLLGIAAYFTFSALACEEEGQ